MAYLMRSLLAGYVLAALSGYWLYQSGAGVLLPFLTFWLGGTVLSMFLVAVFYLLQRASVPQAAAAPAKVRVRER